MINSIDIKNFQSHKHTVLDFTSGLNVIVGTSDSGKSSIVRAMKLVRWNRPSGNAFRSHWGGETKINIYTDNDVISRIKDKNDIYVVNDKELKGFGKNVPEEVETGLNLNSINLQQQIDQPFLISKTPGEVASHFNEIANLTKIDTGLKNIRSWQRKNKQEIETYDKQVTEQKEKLQKYDHLEDFEKAVEEVEKLQNDKEQCTDNIEKLGNIIGSIEEFDIEIEYYSNILSLESIVNERLQLSDNIENLNTICELIENLDKEIAEKEKYVKKGKIVDDVIALYDHRDDVKNNISQLSNLIDNISSLEKEIEENELMLSDENSINKALELYEDREEIDKQINDLQGVVSKIEHTDKKIEELQKKYNDLHLKFENEMPEICPLCGTDLK